jgi:hypothetical protein
VSGGLIELQRELTDPAFLGLDQSPRVMRDQLDLRRGSRSMLAPEQLRPECAPTVEATRRQAACTPPSSSTSATMPTCSSQRDHDRSTSPLQGCSILPGHSKRHRGSRVLSAVGCLLDVERAAGLYWDSTSRLGSTSSVPAANSSTCLDNRDACQLLGPRRAALTSPAPAPRSYSERSRPARPTGCPSTQYDDGPNRTAPRARQTGLEIGPNCAGWSVPNGSFGPPRDGRGASGTTEMHHVSQSTPMCAGTDGLVPRAWTRPNARLSVCSGGERDAPHKCECFCPPSR